MGIMGPETTKMTTDRGVDTCMWYGHMVGNLKDVRGIKQIHTHERDYILTRLLSRFSRVQLCAAP